MGLFSWLFGRGHRSAPKVEPAARGRHAAATADSTMAATHMPALHPSDKVRGKHAGQSGDVAFEAFLGNARVADGIVIDVETIGGGQQLEIIEFGALLLRDYEVIQRFDVFIRPNALLPTSATLLTGITPDQLANAPDAGYVLPGIAAAMNGLAVIGHNVGYDINALGFSCSRYGIGLRVGRLFDTLEMSRALFPDAPSHTLQETMRLVGIDRVEQHRAVNDAEDTFECWMRMRAMDGPRYLSFGERVAREEESRAERARKNAVFVKGMYLDNYDTTPVNKKPDAAVEIVRLEEGVDINGEEKHQQLIGSYGYDAWLWVFVEEAPIRKGKYEGFPAYWVYLDGVEIGHISKYQMERHYGQIPPEGAAMIAHVPDQAIDKERGIYQLRLQMPYRHEPVELKCAKPHNEPVQKMTKRAEAAITPLPVSGKREDAGSRVPVASAFMNPKPHKKVLPRSGRCVTVELDSGVLDDYKDGTWLWLIARPVEGSVSLRLSGQLLGVFCIDGIEFSSSDGNVVAGLVHRESADSRLEVYV